MVGAQPAHLPRRGRAQPRQLRRVAAQARLPADPDAGAAQRGAGGGLILLHRLDGATCRFVDPLCGSGTLPHRGGVDRAAPAAGADAQALRLPWAGWTTTSACGPACATRPARGVAAGAAAADPRLRRPRRRDVASPHDNARAAGIGHLLRFDAARRRATSSRRPGPPGVLLCNPPYGERIGEEKELKPLYRMLGEVVRTRCPGWRLARLHGQRIPGPATRTEGEPRHRFLQRPPPLPAPGIRQPGAFG